MASDLPPFAAAIRAGVPLVMVSHARYTALDRHRIASQSRPIIEGLLRDGLGFRGVVITDSMEAAASLATGRITAASERAVRAGADLLLLTGRGSYAPVYEHLLDEGAAFGVVTGARTRGCGARAGPESGSIVGDQMAESGIDVSIERKDEPQAAEGKRHPNTCPSCGSHYRDEELRAVAPRLHPVRPPLPDAGARADRLSRRPRQLRGGGGGRPVGRPARVLRSAPLPRAACGGGAADGARGGDRHRPGDARRARLRALGHGLLVPRRLDGQRRRREARPRLRERWRSAACRSSPSPHRVARACRKGSSRSCSCRRPCAPSRNCTTPAER